MKRHRSGKNDVGDVEKIFYIKKKKYIFNQFSQLTKIENSFLIDQEFYIL